MTANEQLRDLVLSHQIGLNRLANGEVRRVLSLLSRIDMLLRESLASSVGLPDLMRLERLLAEVQNAIPGVYRDMHTLMRERLIEAGAVEGDVSLRLLERALPREILFALADAVVPSPAFIRQVALSRPFQGKLLRHWNQRLEVNTRRALSKAIRDGIREGDSIPEIMRAIRGTRAAKFTDGILSRVTGAQAEALTRTAVQHVMQGVRLKTYQDSGVVNGYQWLSTLDMRTTLEYCVPRDHLMWDLNFTAIGHNYTWGGGPGRIHWNCRSSSTAVLKSWRELGVDKDDLPASARASMDGRVAGTTDAESWLRRQLSNPARRRSLEQTWGVQRVEWFEAGRLDVADMVKRDGGLLTLRELRQIHGL